MLGESPLTVSVLVWPGAIEDGLKVHVPAVQDRSIVLVKEEGAAAVTVNVVDCVPIRRTLDV